VSNDVLEHLSHKIKDDREGLTEQLARGLVKDHADYLHVVGRISALDAIYAEIKDIQIELEKE
jgi:hypothetical protein